jgi:hypothetical protein
MVPVGNGMAAGVGYQKDVDNHQERTVSGIFVADYSDTSRTSLILSYRVGAVPGGVMLRVRTGGDIILPKQVRFGHGFSRVRTLGSIRE